ncbi:NlpC/P60 family protein [Haloferula sp.]|uniref:NlpC/P60 family protein n=1 Tax=Haloferula sp. TaxID=2497595 RepID=UPI00329D44A7
MIKFLPPKRLLLIATLGSIAGIVVTTTNPVHSKVLNLGFLASLLGTWLGSLIIGWKIRPLRFIFVTLPILALGLLLLPGEEIDSSELRKDYVKRMTILEGTRYHWGGEGANGIDCSGLPRRALRNSLLAYGFRHLNGQAFRIYLEHWWHDASAKALSEGYRNYTQSVGTAGTIRQLDHSGLVAGDLAVTTNGLHVIVYLGGDEWIQADPGIGTVAILNGRTDDNPWFTVPVEMHRWRISEQHLPLK